MIRVLVVEDDQVAAEAHRMYVERVEGFEVAAVVHSGRDALRTLDNTPIDLVLLDLYLPDGHGLDVCRALRAAGHRADVIAVTSARDLALVRAAVSVGVVQYLLKPFTFAGLRDRLQRYARYHEQLAGDTDRPPSQGDIDQAFAVLRTPEAALPKGLSQESLDAVAGAVRSSPDGASASTIASQVGMSRVTARRYLEHLADLGTVARRPSYGRVGRPEVGYHWVTSETQ
jgi:response regulator of citrate/malate metabolism